MAHRLRVLLLEDDPNDAELICHELRRAGFDLDWRRAESREEYLSQLDAHPEVILADYSLPQFDALTALRLLRERELDTPFIIVSGVIGEEIAVSALKQGAADYLLKDRLARLGQAVTHALEQKRLADEKRRADERLKRSERKLAEAQRLAHIGSWEWDIAADEILWSEELYRIFDLEPQEFGATYETYMEHLHPDDRELAERVIGRALQDHQPFAFDHRVVLRDGTVRFVHGRGEFLMDGKGCPIRLVGTAQDITVERRRTEQLESANERLVEANERLEARVEERTASLLRLNDELEARVTERTTELVRSNLVLQQFAYVASHDLQEPLRMVTSFVQLLEKNYKGQLDEKADRWIDHAVSGSTRMQTLINDLLAYSRVGSHGKEFRACETQAALSLALENLQLAISETHAEVTFDALPIVEGDEVQLISLFQNLLENAIKYRGGQSPRIHVSARLEGRDWLFSVRDNGIGIAAEFSERIFIIFQRLHSRKTYPGTGIGLALCKRIVEWHAGCIWLEPEQGEGATFCFTLPAK